ncbi:hypothetical protein J9174_00255 [Macrococcoides canis]|uniref:hypothetical protein n=1 Tax=Macrococcoides canis TaxID=1855823 RepID=UPI001AEC16D8|nr:hypothetical protein [Macrococcus canis]QTQ08153.1 hypothetical protein J9174_00255 [Macrococcus canis]UTH02492.1 hypothetical protein KFV05_00380 [Macrococcus canis]
MIYFNLYHPEAVYIDYRIEEFSNKFENIKKQYPGKIYVVRIEDKKYCEKFLKEGFKVCRKTYEIQLDNTCLFNNFVEYDKECFELTDELICKWYQIYNETHKVNPVKEFDLEVFKNLLKRDLDLKHSILIKDNSGVINAYALLYSDDNTTEIGYVYYKDETHKKMLKETLNCEMKIIFETGKKYISIEVDDTDNYSYELFKGFINKQTPLQRTLIFHSK